MATKTQALKTKTQEVIAFMSKYEIYIFAIADTKLKNANKLRFKNLKIGREDRPDLLHAAGRVLVLIRNSVSYKRMKP